MKKIIKLQKIDTALKEANYLAFCQSLSESERIAYLEKISADMWAIWSSNPDNLSTLEPIDESRPTRVQRLRKFKRKIN